MKIMIHVNYLNIVENTIFIASTKPYPRVYLRVLKEFE